MSALTLKFWSVLNFDLHLKNWQNFTEPSFILSVASVLQLFSKESRDQDKELEFLLVVKYHLQLQLFPLSKFKSCCPQWPPDSNSQNFHESTFICPFWQSLHPLHPRIQQNFMLLPSNNQICRILDQAWFWWSSLPPHQPPAPLSQSDGRPELSRDNNHSPRLQTRF